MAVIIPTQEVAPGALNTGGVVSAGSPRGAELGEGISELIKARENVRLVQQRQRNADRLFQAETALGDEYRAFESQAQKRTGQDAWGITEDATQWWSEKLPEYLDNLENDAQRQLFKESAGKMRNSSLNSFSDFESAQRQASLQQSALASIDSARDFGAAHYNDPEALEQSRTDILERIDVLSNLNGWDEATKTAEVEAQMAAFHRQVVENMVDDSPAEARKYFEDNIEDIRGSKRDEFKDLLETGEVQAAGQEGSDSIYDPEKTETAALAEARRRYKGKERDEVVARLKVRYAEDRAVQQQNEREATDQAWEIFSRTGKTSSIPPSIYSRMDPKLALSMRAQEFNPSDMVSTSWETYTSLTDLAQSDPAAFARVDLRTHYHELNIRERDYLGKVQAQILENGEAGLGGLTTQLTEASRVMGWKQSDAETRGMFERKVREQIAEFQKSTGQAATYEQRQTIIDRLLSSGEVTGGGFFGLVDPDRQYFQVVGTPGEADFVVDIPEAERYQIEQALEANGLPVTDENVRNLYRTKLGL